MARYILKLFGILTIMLSVSVVSAQPTARDPEPDGSKPGTAPLGGLEILLLAGGALGIKKIVSSKKKKE